MTNVQFQIIKNILNKGIKPNIDKYKVGNLTRNYAEIILINARFLITKKFIDRIKEKNINIKSEWIEMINDFLIKIKNYSNKFFNNFVFFYYVRKSELYMFFLYYKYGHFLCNEASNNFASLSILAGDYEYKKYDKAKIECYQKQLVPDDKYKNNIEDNIVILYHKKLLDIIKNCKKPIIISCTIKEKQTYHQNIFLIVLGVAYRFDPNISKNIFNMQIDYQFILIFL